MTRAILGIGLIASLLVAVIADAGWARGFGGGGFRGGGGGGFRGGGGFGGGGGFHGGGYGGGGFRGGGGIPQGSGWSGGGGFSGGGFHPAPASRPSFQSRPSFNQPAGNIGGGGARFSNPNVVHRPQTGGPGLDIGSRPQTRPGGGITRPDLAPGNQAGFRPGGQGRPGLPAGAGTRPGDGARLNAGTRPGSDAGSLPGLGPARPGQGGAGTRQPGNRPGQGGAGTRQPDVRPGEGGAGTQRPGTRPGEGVGGAHLPGMRPGQGGAGEQWNLPDRGTIEERHEDLANRFDDLQENWNDSNWHHQQWDGPNGGELNHFSYWGPNGYWGHSGVWGSEGGHWGHTGHVGPEGAWGHTGYFGPAGHWSRNWGWYNGYSPAWGNGRWDYLWDEYPVAMGFGATMWGLNAVDWMFGVGGYYNPYYDSPVYVDNQAVASYSEPIVGDPAYATEAEAVENESGTVANDSTAPAESASDPSDPLTDTFDEARQAFYDGQFEEALTLTNQTLALAPKDAAINEFRSLCLFSLGQYRESAATIHAVLAAGPGWDWTTLISLYGNRETYTAQLRDLEAAVRENPNSADLRFLLGYHYLTGGHQDAAVSQWQMAVELQPDDKLAAQLVQMYEPSTGEASKAQSTPPPDLEKPAYPLEKLQGDWTAREEDGEFTLKLAEDDSFTWTFTRDGKPQSVSGAYVVRGDNLVMQPDSGGTMLSTITLKDDQTLEFAPIGDAHDLTFTR